MFGDVYGWSQEFTFTAAPKPGPDVTTRVVAYGGEGSAMGEERNGKGWKLAWTLINFLLQPTDMGNGQLDDSRQVITKQQPALNTTRLVTDQIDQTDVILHIGDISYARGYASVVGPPLYNNQQ